MNTEQNKPKIIRTAAVPSSLHGLLHGQLAFLNQYYTVIGVASKGPLLQETAKREGIRTKAITIRRNISPIQDLKSLFVLYLFLKREKPLLVHSITPKAGLLSMVAAYFAGVPYRLHTFTGLIFPTQTGLKKKLLIFFDRIICKAATHIYPEGNGVKKDLQNYRITKKPLKIIAYGNVNGINLNHFDPERYTPTEINTIKATLCIPKNHIVFVYVGRLVNDKGINELATAYATLKNKYDNCSLLLVGSAEGETDLLPKKTLALLSTVPNLISVGQQKDIRPFLAVSNLFVFPSYREGFPNVVLEACAMQLPCIVTNINGSNEIITHNVNGTVIPAQNTDALIDAMQSYLQNPELIQKHKEGTRQLIIEKFERSFVWNEILKEYQSIINTQTQE
ncbi:glycosyltransferase family 1 protein [Croceivirga radicis]|uniref:Glycosyltransferase family 1 protein n=1 Tax=Croceivirga radicis TaxID=1929488 RepID=A0A1V6LSD5_9FLAO|nr:glycosyltransferase family 4 protein [Croceivirga radicis]OQD43085.1 glycosyltransferase family 1 protein [Croceivirga radicis]